VLLFYFKIMANYSKSSSDKLNTAEQDLITLFNFIVEYFDNTILYGHRDIQLQQELFAKGRRKEGGKWIIENKKLVVTYCDGVLHLSEHNFSPSRAVDALPYPINGEDRERMYFFAGHVMMAAKILKKQGKITHDITWGGDWDGDTLVHDQTFMDLAHYQIKK